METNVEGLQWGFKRNVEDNMHFTIMLLCNVPPVTKKKNLSAIIFEYHFPFSALTLFVGQQVGHLDCKKFRVGLLVVTV